jgi:hypothetical protein
MSGGCRTVFTFTVLCVLLGSAGAAEAQPLSPYRQYSSAPFLNGKLREAFQNQWRANSERLPVKPTLAGSSFRPVGTVGPTVHKRVASSVQTLDATRRHELEAALLKLLTGYEQQLEQREEERLKNNLAGAFNFFFAQAWYVLKDGQLLNEAQRENMLEQLNSAIVAGLNERRLSDLEKQELYEAAVLAGSVIVGLYNEGKDLGRQGQEQVRTARELARELLGQMMGINLEKVRVTDTAVRVD